MLPTSSYKSLSSTPFLIADHQIEELRSKGKTIYPSPSNIYRAFLRTPPDKIRIVILGQDPYHSFGQADGLAFSVPIGVPAPPSLRNIFKELKDEGYERNKTDLSDWAEQGVLLLNTALTVEEGKPGSHSEIWKDPIRMVIEEISSIDHPIVWILWGSHAASYRSLLRNTLHTILTAPHPSPLSSYRGFFGCGHFREANEWLKRRGTKEIVWGD